MRAVRQKPHIRAQPTWLEAHIVMRSRRTMQTVSTVPPPGRDMPYFTVPSSAVTRAEIVGTSTRADCERRVRRDFGRSVKAPMSKRRLA